MKKYLLLCLILLTPLFINSGVITTEPNSLSGSGGTIIGDLTLTIGNLYMPAGTAARFNNIWAIGESGGTIYVGGGGPLSLGADANNHIKIANGGNVGIGLGTGTPNSKLSISSSTVTTSLQMGFYGVCATLPVGIPANTIVILQLNSVVYISTETTAGNWSYVKIGAQ